MRKIFIGIIALCIIILLIYLTYNDNKQKENEDSLPTNVVFYDGGSIDEEDTTYRDYLINSYQLYQEITNHFAIVEEIPEKDFVTYDYLAVIYENDYCNGNLSGVEKVDIADKVVTITLGIIDDKKICPMNYDLLFIRVDKDAVPKDFVSKFNYVEVE